MVSSASDSVEFWSRSGQGGSAQHCLAGTVRVPFTDGPFTGFMDLATLRPGLFIYRIEGRADHAFRLQSDQTAPEGSLIAGCMLAGAGTMGPRGGMHQLWRPGGVSYLLDPSADLVDYDVLPGSIWHLVAVRLEGEAMAQYADRAATGPMGEILRGRQRAYTHAIPLDRRMRAVAQSIMAPVYTGRMQALYAEARALELLAYQFDSFSGEPSYPVDLTPVERGRLRQARDLLLAELRDPPSLAGLASVARMSERRLNFGFRTLFGATAFELLRDARLDVARDLMLQMPDLPLKQVAFRIGFADPSNFVKAYRRRFGVTPGLHRRLKPD